MATLTGTNAHDLIDGTPDDDLIFGLGGNDTLHGSDGNDQMFGGPGHDFLGFLDEGDDLVYGGPGHDFIDGVEFDGGDDWMDGGPGDDVFSYVIQPWAIFPPYAPGVVPIGNDTIIGGSGTDLVVFSFERIQPTPGAQHTGTAALVIDLENGTWNTAEVSGTIVGVEQIIGSASSDTILGSRGADALSGSGGNDVIDGRGGKDRLEGGLGFDTLNGGAGRDEFVFAAQGFTLEFGALGADVIEDFTPGRDELLFENRDDEALGAEGQWRDGDERFYAAAGATSGHDSNDRIVYDTNAGNLYYDADGSGAGAPVLMATLESAPALSASDITII